ncbi:hypothetical protein GCM10027174_36760 [Salinifilum aidingensis]
MNTDTRSPGPATGWFKSTFSNPSQDCVEVLFDTEHVHVRDSKDQGTGLVLTLDARHWPDFLAEALGTVETGSNRALRIRPTDDGGARLRTPDGGTALTFTPAEWDAFTAGARTGEFDLPNARHAEAPAMR